MNRKAITQMQAAIVALIIVIAAIAGAYYYLSQPSPSPSPSPTPTPTPTPGPTPTPTPTPGPTPTPTPKPTPTPTPTPAPLKVAAIFHDPVSLWESAFDVALLEALKINQKKYGYVLDWLEQVPDVDTERIMMDYAEEGYDIIWLMGIQDDKNAKAGAEKYPDVNFMVVHYMNFTQPNLGIFLPVTFQGYYPAGVLAALMTKTGVVGIVGGAEIASPIADANAFKLGVNATNPDVRVVEIFTGVADPVAAKEAAISAIEEGADILAGTYSGSTPGCVRAAEQYDNVYVIGDLADWSQVSDRILTTVLWNLEPVVADVVERTLKGESIGNMYLWGYPNGISLAPLSDKVPQEVKSQVKQVEQDIIDGKIQVPYIPERT